MNIQVLLADLRTKLQQGEAIVHEDIDIVEKKLDDFLTAGQRPADPPPAQ